MQLFPWPLGGEAGSTQSLDGDGSPLTAVLRVCFVVSTGVKRKQNKVRIETDIVSIALPEISSPPPPSQIQTCPQRARPEQGSSVPRGNQNGFVTCCEMWHLNPRGQRGPFFWASLGSRHHCQTDVSHCFSQLGSPP